jgi:hypothetical protein
MKPTPALPSATMKSAEQNLAQDDQSQRLPVADQFQSKEPRHQPVPQTHDDETQPGKEYDNSTASNENFNMRRTL